MKRRATFIALLRGINLGGRNRVPMANLRSLAADLGWRDAQTYIQSGNLVFTGLTAASTAESQLERGIERHFKLRIPVIVRPATEWSGYVDRNPFPDVVQSQPAYVILALSKQRAQDGALLALQQRADKAERVLQLSDDAFCIHFGRGLGRSRLFGLLDRLVGCPVTARNWLTVLKLRELAKQSSTRAGAKVNSRSPEKPTT